MKPMSHGFRSIVGTANYAALTTGTPSRQEVAPPPHPLPPPSQPNHTSFHILLSHGHDCRRTRAVVWAASRGALATCDRVSQLSALSGIGIGALAFIRTSLVLRFLPLPKVPHHAPAPSVQQPPPPNEGCCGSILCLTHYAYSDWSDSYSSLLPQCHASRKIQCSSHSSNVHTTSEAGGWPSVRCL